MPSYPIPSIPVGLFYGKFLFNVQNQTQVQDFTMDFMWLNSTLPGGTWNSITALLDFSAQVIVPCFKFIRPQGLGTVGARCFHNLGTRTTSLPISPLFPVTINGPFLLQQVCPAVTKRTFFPGRAGTGVIFFPPVPQIFIDGQDYSAGAYALYGQALDVLMTPWTSQGISFLPVHWARRSNVVYPIETLTLCKYPRIRRKRREVYPYVRAPFGWPNVI